MNIPEDLKYAETHEWVRLDGDIATIGISDHAQEQLGELVYVELPEIGAVFEATNPAAVVESVKAASDVYAPVSGEVTEINEALETAPEKVNQTPYDEGWLFKLRLNDSSATEGLLDAKSYREANGL